MGKTVEKAVEKSCEKCDKQPQLEHSRDFWVCCDLPSKIFWTAVKKKLTRKLYGRQGRQQQTRTLPETTINITPAFPNNLQRKYLQTFFVIY
jgi:hypothetical protein